MNLTTFGLLLAIALCIISSSTATADVVSASSPLLTLHTCTNSNNNKQIKGVWMNVTNPRTKQSRRVASFRGIRFGEKPVRFAGPVAHDLCTASPEDQVIDATQFSPMCSQLSDDGTSVVGSEDCLFLNVYISENILNLLNSKQQNNQKQLFPVSHYFFGGSLVSGNAADENHAFFSAFAGDSENDEYGVVAITPNYRLSILGFLGSAAFEKDVNFGIQDMILSLKWTQNFVQNFGGDKSQVTISGQSSGGTAVFALMASSRTQGLFRSAFSMSGSPNITQDRTSKILQDLPIIEKLGCIKKLDTSFADQLHCLRSLPVQTLFNAVPDFLWNTPYTWGWIHLEPSGRHFQGLVYVDGDIVAIPFKDSVRNRLNENVTLVIQTEGQECNLVTPYNYTQNFTQLQWKEFLRDSFRNWGKETSEKMANEFYNLYEDESRLNPQLAYASGNTDYGITCPSPDIARQISFAKRNKNGFVIGGASQEQEEQNRRVAPIYISVNQWPPQNPNNFNVLSMSYHLWDYVAATHQWFSTYTPQEQDFDLAFKLRAAWYKLMKTGRMDGLNPEWLPVDEGEGVRETFPGNYNTMVWSRSDRYPFRESGMVKSYKDKICRTFFAYGLDENFWWCN